MIQDSAEVVRRSLSQAHPEYTEAELKVAFFERYYGHEFSAEERERIAQALLQYQSKQQA